MISALLAESGVVGQAGIDALVPYLNLGLIVVLLVMFLRNIGVVPKWTYDELKSDHEGDLDRLKEVHGREVEIFQGQIAALQADVTELKATNADLTRATQDDFLPALIEANRLTAAYVQAIERRVDISVPPS